LVTKKTKETKSGGILFDDIFKDQVIELSPRKYEISIFFGIRIKDCSGLLMISLKAVL